MPKKEICSNCGKDEVEKIIITAFIMRTKKYESVVVRQCGACKHLSSINRLFGC